MKKSKENLSSDEKYWLEAFQGFTVLGSFYRGLVDLWRIADLNNQRKLAKAFPLVARGYELWLSGEYN